MTLEVKLKEAVTGAARNATGKRRRAKIIAADVWGSTAYYPSEVLERDGARVFVAGTQMFENHMTENERWERPEGDVGKLIGKLSSDALYEAAGEDGPGLYADVEFYDSYLDRINEIGDDIGLSVNASGLTEEGEMDGRYGPILVALLSAQSVDVVTRAGAGGKLTSILESDRELAGRPIETKGEQSMSDVTKSDLDALETKLIDLFESFSASLKEAIQPAEVEAAKETEVVEPNPAAVVEAEAVEIDHAAIIEALRENDLPAVSAKAVIHDITENKLSLEDAIGAQVKLREAFTATAGETGTVVTLQESGNESGLNRAVKILG